MDLDGEAGQGEGAEGEKGPGRGIAGNGLDALPVGGQPGDEGILEGGLVVIEEYAEQPVVRAERASETLPYRSQCHRV